MKTLQREKTRMSQPIFGIGNQERSPFISTVDRVNCVVEMSENGRQPIAVVGLPGLTEHATFGDAPARGIFVKEGTTTFFIAAGSQLMKVSKGQPVQTIATFATDSGPVWIDDNGIELFINDGETAMLYNHSTGVVSNVSDTDYPSRARGGAFLQGRFWVYVQDGTNAGKVFASDLYNGNGWDPLNFITPEARPSGIVSVFRWADDLVILGQKTVEWWSGTPSTVSGALGFQPSAPANTEVGCTAERGIAKVGQRLFFIGHTDGVASAFEIEGYKVKVVSTERTELDFSSFFVSSAICTGYTTAGHALFQITIPGQSATTSACWVLDVGTGQWSRRESSGVPYYRGLLAVNALSRVYITDAYTGTLYEMDESTYMEGTDEMPFEVVSTHLLNDGDVLTVNSIQIDMETGRGQSSGTGSNPRGLLSVSKDGGKTWCMHRMVHLGKIGEYRTRAQEYRFGSARDWAFRFRITEPVPRHVTGAYLNPDQGFA